MGLWEDDRCALPRAAKGPSSTSAPRILGRSSLSSTEMSLIDMRSSAKSQGVNQSEIHFLERGRFGGTGAQACYRGRCASVMALLCATTSVVPSLLTFLVDLWSYDATSEASNIGDAVTYKPYTRPFLVSALVACFLPA